VPIPYFATTLVPRSNAFILGSEAKGSEAKEELFLLLLYIDLLKLMQEEETKL